MVKYHHFPDWGEALGFILFLLVFVAVTVFTAVGIELIQRILDWWWERTNRR
jgi:hypothetical protein